jgi:hypothetical protein
MHIYLINVLINFLATELVKPSSPWKLDWLILVQRKRTSNYPLNFAVQNVCDNVTKGWFNNTNVPAAGLHLYNVLCLGL